MKIILIIDKKGKDQNLQILLDIDRIIETEKNIKYFIFEIVKKLLFIIVSI